MDHAGRRLFIDEFRPGGRLLEVDPAGHDEPRVLLDDLAGPNAPAMGPDGKLYFPQVFADEIWCYDLDTGEARLVAGDLPRPTAVKFDSRGRLVTSVAGAGRIVAIDLATGAQEVLAEVPLGIDNVSVGPDDRIFVSHYVDGRVAEETAGRQRVLSPPGLLGPHGLAVDADGTILFADGLSIGAVVDGVAERRHRLLVDLPTLAHRRGPVRRRARRARRDRRAAALRRRRRRADRARRRAARVDAPSASTATACSSPTGPTGASRAVDADGATSPVLDGLAGAGIRRPPRRRLRDRRRRGRARRSTPPASRRRVDGFGDAQGVAVIGSHVLVADAARHELVLVDVAAGRREVVVAGAPIGRAVAGAVVPAAFASVAADGAGGYLVGCNGDGSIRRLSR